MGSNNGQSKWMRKSKTMKLGLNGNKVSEATIAAAAVVQFIHLQQQSMLLIYYCDHVIVIMRDKLNNRGKNCNKVCRLLLFLYYCITVLLYYCYYCTSILELKSATAIAGILELRPAQFAIKSNFVCFS